MQKPDTDSAQSAQHKPSFWQKNWVKNGLTILVFVGIYLMLRPFMQGDVMHGAAPTMQVQSISGKTLDLQALNQQGKPVLIHIWATWCPICEVSKEGIESLAKDYAVINIASQSGEDATLLSYAKENGLDANIIVNDASGHWMTTFGAKAVPADFIINPAGQIEFVEVGFTTAWGLRLRLWWAGLNTSTGHADKTAATPATMPTTAATTATTGKQP